MDKVITHQWKSAFNDMRYVTSMEFSGLGKFTVSRKRLIRRIAFYQRYMDYISQDPEKNAEKMMTTKDQIDLLKGKLPDEVKYPTYTTRNKQLSIRDGGDRTDSQGEV